MLYADRVIEYSEFKQINILKEEGRMDGQLKVAAVQVTVEQNNIKKNMENVEKMAMSQQNRWKLTRDSKKPKIN